MSKRKLPQPGDKEVRRWAIEGLELREDPTKKTVTLDGYASVVDSPYEMYGGPDKGGWMETLAAGAFDKTLAEGPDVQLLINHEGLPLARTKSGTMKLSADPRGLRTLAELDPADPDVVSIRGKMARKDLDEMSFAFRTVRQEWNEDYTDRRILEVNLHKGDVSVVNYGANPATSVALRKLAERRAAGDGGPDPDEDTGALAQAVDAILDEIAEALSLNDIPTVSALLTGAQATIDALLDVLAVPDADDDPNEPGEPAARAREDALTEAVGLSTDAGGPFLTLAEARALLESPEAIAS